MAFTTIPAAGAKLRASTLSALVTEVRPIAARKSATETVNNSAALQNDDELFVSVEANATYDLDMLVRWSSAATPDFKFDFTIPTLASGAYTVTALAGGNLFLGDINISGGSATIDGDGTTKQHQIIGTLVTGANAGTLQFRWAQGTANASDTQVFANSTLVLRRTA